MNRKFVIPTTVVSSFLFFFGYFITGCTLRSGIYNNRFLEIFPPLVIIGVIMIVFSYNKKKGALSNRKFDYKQFSLFIILLFISILSFVVYKNFQTKILSMFTIIVPSIIMCYRFKSTDEFETLLKMLADFLKIAICIILVGDIIDILTNYSFSQFIANFTNISSYYVQAKYHRSVSFFGHPLFTAEIILIYYIVKNLYNNSNAKKNKIIPFILALFCMIMTKSRVGFILLIVSFLVFNHNMKQAKYIFLGLLFLFLGYEFGLFDTIITRFSTFGRADIRNTKLMEVLSNGTLRFYLFNGQNLADIGYSTPLAVALEYPLLRWAYNFGIINAILLSLLYFIYPLFLLIVRKQKTLILSLFIIILDVNSFSALGDTGLKPLLYIIFVCFIMNFSNYILYRNGSDSNDKKNTN